MTLLTDQAMKSVVQRVNMIYPDFHVESARWVNSGQNNDVIIVNDSWIFRVPHNSLAANNLQNEVAVLRMLAGNLPLEIPFPTYVHIDPANAAQSFIGYHIIAGQPLRREWIHDTDMNQLDRAARDLDDFMKALHMQSVPKELSGLVPVANTFNYWLDMYERIQRLLFPLMRTEACAQVSDHFESFLATVEDFNVALIHGDLGPSNILVDESAKTVTGVIDFGSVGIGDPAVDYAAVSTIHPQILDVMSKYNPTVVEYIPRIDFYKGTFALQEALYGAESGDEEALRAGLKQYI